MTDDQRPLSVHVAGSWWMWCDSALRAAGFAIDDLLRLGQSKLAAAADGGADDAEFRASYQNAIDESCTALVDIAEGRAFRSAVLWQNRKIVYEVIDPYLAARRAGRGRDSRQRQREIALTKYIQRYHAKNDSIGFFGPVGWAHWTGDVEGTTAEGEPVLAVTGVHSDIVDRRAQLEHWAVRALADQISTDPEVRRWLTPTPAPTIKVADGRVHSALRGWFAMPSPRIDVLAACDGHTTVIDIARRLLADDVPGIVSTEDVDRELTTLERAGHIAVNIAVAPTFHPDQSLRRRIGDIPDYDTRTRHLAALDRVQAVAQQVRDASGDPNLLTPALSDLESVFTELSGERASRPHAGRQVSGRALMVEDCRSAVDVTLRPWLLADLAAPFDLMLASARWLVHSIGARYLAILGEIHRGMARGEPGVGLAAICSEFFSRCTGDSVRVEAAPSVEELRRRWAQILAVPVDTRRHRVASADIAAAVRDQFAAPSAPWLSGRFHCPDVMIAAADVAAVSRGDFEWVLGEMHTAQNTLNQGVFMLSHPESERVRAMADEDARRVRGLIPIYPSNWPEISARAYPPPYIVSDAYEYLRLAAEPPRDAMVDPGVPIAALTMVRGPGDALWVEADDGRRWHPLGALGEFLTESVADAFQPFGPGAHRPRVNIDRLVIGRERWQLPVGTITWPWVRDEADRYRAARRWATDLGLARYVFVRVIGQPKPYYVDLTSPMLLTMIASTLRAEARDDEASVVTISEMYPGPDDLWTPHSNPDRRCTSELRLAIVDRG